MTLLLGWVQKHGTIWCRKFSTRTIGDPLDCYILYVYHQRIECTEYNLILTALNERAFQVRQCVLLCYSFYLGLLDACIVSDIMNLTCNLALAILPCNTYALAF